MAERSRTPRVIVALGGRRVPYVNASYRRSGTLWEGRYKSSLIQSDAYLLACMRYIADLAPRDGYTIARGQHRHLARAGATGLEVHPASPRIDQRRAATLQCDFNDCRAA